MRSSSSFPKLKGRAVLSPMAGVTNVAFRVLAKRYGAAMTYTEFVSSHAIVRGSEKTNEMLETDPIEKPVVVQLFGSGVEEVVSAAKTVEPDFDVIDVNCGCPAWKVIKIGAGSELLKKPEGIAHFISKMTSAVNKPVTVKIRTGIDDKNINAVEVAKICEDAGAAAIAIHGRTQKQGYSGVADWNIIKEVKDAVSVPVIGNGDVFTPETFKERLEQSGVDYIMIARGALGNPYIFTQIESYLKDETYDEKNKLEQFSEYLALAIKHKISFSTIKMNTPNFTKGIVGGAKIREQLNTCKTIEELKQIIDTAREQEEQTARETKRY